MIGILLIYYIGKQFYNLAIEYKKNKWGFAILGVIFYYAGIFIGAVLLGIYYELYLETSIDDANNILFGLMTIPFGLLICWGFYKLLEKQWVKNVQEFNIATLDEEMLE